tara:strand:+ start:240 stop:449 length:210 start_codon:yes stop_codon:yes gene_type:complete
MWNWLKKLVGPKAEPKRAREKGRYKADDKSTADVNEAWVGGVAPTPEKEVKVVAKKVKQRKGANGQPIR